MEIQKRTLPVDEAKGSFSYTHENDIFPSGNVQKPR
jgi:hypothetical protein